MGSPCKVKLWAALIPPRVCSGDRQPTSQFQQLGKRLKWGSEGFVGVCGIGRGRIPTLAWTKLGDTQQLQHMLVVFLRGELRDPR
jgi:hypothetical protein